MNRFQTFFASTALAAALALAGCVGDTSIGSDLRGLNLRDGLLTAHAQGQPDAVITVAGDLRIDDKPVVVTAAQRKLLQSYYGAVVGIRKAGIETGKAGAAMAGKALGEVAKGLANGDTDHIDSKMEEQTKDIEKKAMMVCDGLQVLQSTQGELAASLPAFKPYATIASDAVVRCRDDHTVER